MFTYIYPRIDSQVVILGVAGSSPVTHPTGQRAFLRSDLLPSRDPLSLACR
jgi:hypothetical protein